MGLVFFFCVFVYLLEVLFFFLCSRPNRRGGRNSAFSATVIATTTFIRAALKGTNLKGRTPICGLLRKSAVFCENLRFPNASFSWERARSCKNQRKSAKICVWARFVPLSSSP